MSAYTLLPTLVLIIASHSLCSAFTTQFRHINALLSQQRTRLSTATTSATSSSKLFMIGDFFNFDKKGQKKDDDAKIVEEEETTSQKSNEIVDEDPVEKMFNFFFGEKEEKPMGLARFGSERFPGEIFLNVSLCLKYNGCLLLHILIPIEKAIKIKSFVMN